MLTRPFRHYALLSAILCLGLLLRFWHLDAKPLWLDEVLSGLFTTGHSYRDVPLDQFFPLTALDSLFTVQTGQTCTQISQTLSRESVHPPLFFCLMYGWMSWLRPDATHWVWTLRALPALLGVGAIATTYLLGRIAFSPLVGLVSASLMAVSPFAVYLSQEARHYTLPMVLINLALTGLIAMQRDLIRQRPRAWIWFGWMVVNSLGLYVHYFFILALVAQVVALVGWMLWQRRRIIWRYWVAVGLAIAGIALSYVPWIPTLINHFSRPETDWLIPYKPDWLDHIAPIYQTLISWVLMIVALPVENQPWAIALLSGLVMVGVAIGLAASLYRGWKQVWQSTDSSNAASFRVLCSFTVCVILEFFAIVYILGKDITVVPRYTFVYYPTVCIILGSILSFLYVKNYSLSQSKILSKYLMSPLFWVIAVGSLSSGLVVNGLVFQKPFYPNQVAQTMANQTERPLLVAVTYESPQEVALGLSFALALQRQTAQHPAQSSAQVAFLDRSSGYSPVWKSLAQLPQPLSPPLNLWVVASPGMKSKDYPRRIKLAQAGSKAAKLVCTRDDNAYHRIGFPYQRFRCNSKKIAR